VHPWQGPILQKVGEHVPDRLEVIFSRLLIPFRRGKARETKGPHFTLVLLECDVLSRFGVDVTLRQTKVNDEYMVVLFTLAYQKVLRFDISMDESLLVNQLQPGETLYRNKCNCFLGELLVQVEHGKLPAKDWLKVTNQALKLTTNNRAVKLARKHGINWAEILPLTAITKSQDEKIKRFQQQQLEQGYKKSKGNSI